MSGQHHTVNEPVNARIFPKPPVVALIFIGAAFALEYVWPFRNSSAEVPTESQIGGAVIMACSVAIAVLAAREMTGAKTTFMPGEKASALVQTGVYKRSRNPMYLSLTLFTLGLGIATANLWMIVFAPLLLLYFQERVVKREEAYLTGRFGQDYLAFRREVRRWI